MTVFLDDLVFAYRTAVDLAVHVVDDLVKKIQFFPEVFVQQSDWLEITTHCAEVRQDESGLIRGRESFPEVKIHIFHFIVLFVELRVELLDQALTCKSSSACWAATRVPALETICCCAAGRDA